MWKEKGKNKEEHDVINYSLAESVAFAKANNSDVGGVLRVMGINSGVMFKSLETV